MTELEDYKKDLEKLKELLAKREEVYTITSVSKSGMTRWIKLFVVDDDFRLWNITHLVSNILVEKLNKEGKIKVRGVGFSAPQQIVYYLGLKLFGKDCLKYKEIG